VDDHFFLMVIIDALKEKGSTLMDENGWIHWFSLARGKILVQSVTAFA
jgi:hypothetical protein